MTGVRQTSMGGVSLIRGRQGEVPGGSLSRRSGKVVVAGTAFDVTVREQLGTMRVSGTSGGELYLEVQEVAQTEAGIHVDTTARRYDERGNLTGSTRVQRSDLGPSPYQEIEVTGEGDLLTLRVGHDRVDVLRLRVDRAPLVQVVSSTTPNLLGLDEPVATMATACVYSRTMVARAGQYSGNSKYLSSTNIGGACSGRTRPRYLGSAGTYASVPYNWGGFSSVSGFNSEMSPATGRAGNINTSAQPSCSYGVDCSGLVSRIWGLPSKHGTSTIPNVSHRIWVSNGRAGDVFNLAGKHVMMFHRSSGGGYYVTEATTSSSLDRVTYRWIPTSTVSGYDFRRYQNWCCDPASETCPQ